MFKNRVMKTELTDKMAEEVLGGKVFGDMSIRGDVSFLATMRALLCRRMGDEDFVHCERRVVKFGEISSDSFKALCSLAEGLEHQYIINDVIAVTGDGSIAEVIRPILRESYPELEEIQKISNFFMGFEVLCFVDRQKQNTILFVENLNVHKIHLLQAAILPSVPWFFERDKDVSPVEMKLIKSLSENSADSYLSAIGEIARDFDMRPKWIRKKLADFESEVERKYIRDYEERIVVLRASIANYKRQLGREMAALNDTIARHQAVSWCVNNKSGESEILNYVLCNKNISVIGVDGTQLKFEVGGFLSYFDEDTAEAYINNTSSIMYRGIDDLDPAAVTKFYNALFLERTIKLRFCAAFNLDIGDMTVTALEGHEFGSEFSEFMPNPHLDSYGCMGNYTMVIEECLGEKNYIGAIEQCAASAISLNFSDITVMRNFLQRLFNDDFGRIVELPNGQVATVAETMAWLQAKTEETKTEDA